MNTPPPEFHIAKAFDFAYPDTGPGFAPDHLVVTDDAERERLLSYLRSGAPVLLSTARMPDILDPRAGQVVPVNLRTDGEWIWSDAVGYYLDHHRLAPDPRLAAHITTRYAAGSAASDVDQETALRAADQLLHPPGEAATRAAWVHDSGAV